MYIKSVELENIKSHADSKFEFSPGSTAITGRNGAGKTTIIEAVAWALFDLLDYKKDDFLRRGSKKGSVRVTFESGIDERAYLIYRDTGTGYYVYDPQLKVRIADKKEDVTRFLWQHLGVEPGTDLESLFKHAIGVPQGTFTAIFLSTAAQRKKTFDVLLKVEEYRRGAEELLKTQRFVENGIAALREKIARSEGELARVDDLRAALTVAAQEVDSYALTLSAAESSALKIADTVAQMDRSETRLNAARADFDVASAAKTRAEIVHDRAAKDLSESQDAVMKIESVRSKADQHTTALGRIAELERERAERDRVRTVLSKVETAIAAVRAESDLIKSKLDDADSAVREMAELKQRLPEQEHLEQRLSALQSEAASIAAMQDRREFVDTRLAQLRESFTKTDLALKQAREKTPLAARLPAFIARESELITELATLNATLERDEQFKKQIKDGLCPVLSEKCLNLKNGQTLEGFILDQFGELRSQIAALETERSKINAKLAESREAEIKSSGINDLERRRAELTTEGLQFKAEREVIQAALARSAELTSEIGLLKDTLERLENPKARLAFLQRNTTNAAELRAKLSNIESDLERLEADARTANEQMESFRDLDAHWLAATLTRDETAESYRTFLLYQSAAAALPTRENDLAATAVILDQTVKQAEKAELSFNAAIGAYDPVLHGTKKDELTTSERLAAETAVRLENATRRKEDLAVEEERLMGVREILQTDFRERERREQILETAVFIRDTLKEAAPLVARNYVYRVSAEASQLFREITGDAERTLRWTEDYSVVLDDNGYERPFQSLSGGEQMAAALSVRLALLKQLSDIRIAFFDEPTTNMDAERRENLAMQIGQITHFDQLFVISHDDTFDGYMDHEVRIDRDEL